MEILTALGLLFVGAAILVSGGEILVRGATKFSAILAISPIVVGLTVVAAGTSAPELAVSIMSCLKENGDPGMALGNVVGSGICNILLVLAVPALIRPLKVSGTLIKREMPFMIFVSLLLWAVAAVSFNNMAHCLPQWAGFFFFAMYLAYCGWTIHEIRRGDNKELIQSMEESCEPVKKGVGAVGVSLLCIVAGLALLVLGSNWFIDGAVTLATILGVSKLVIGLTVLALGTSLPELVVSTVSVVRGRTDLAIGNVVGSNIFNVLVVLGLSVMFMRNGIPVSSQSFYLDIPVMVGAAVLGTWFCATGKTLNRLEGFVLLVFYCCYIAWLFVQGGVA